MTQPFPVLLVDDDDGDIMLVQGALEEAGVELDLHVCHDGAEALAFLRQEPPHESAPRPRMVLMDINMPRLNGLEALKAIREDEGLRGIPVIMLTTSSDNTDVMEAYGTYANAYVTKPVDLDSFNESLGTLARYWSKTVVTTSSKRD